MSDKLIKGLNDQFNFEIESGYLYLAMSAYFKEEEMNGFAHFMAKQAHEEFEHAKGFYDFIFALGGKVEYEEVAKPKSEYKDFNEAFKDALEHEKLVAEKIEALYAQALEEDNYKVLEFLGQYVTEQVEEIDTFNGIMTKLERINGAWSGLYIFDSELAQRQ